MADPAPRRAAVRWSPASDAAMTLLSAFVREGVRDVVVAPGSRSQALALAAAELERVGAIRLHVRIDERGAAFLALGTAVESGRPAIVVTTSGTAVANLHPAVLEAHHSGVPLIVCSADRPADLRGIRSNQTTMQPGIFAGALRLERDIGAPEGEPGEADAATRLARDAVAAALGRDAAGEPTPHPGPGPVHLNLQYREPLSAVIALDEAPRSERADAAASAGPDRFAAPVRVADELHGAPIESGPRTVVVAGAGAGPAAEEFARAGGWPLLAEVSSGAHFGPNLVVAYRELLREPGFGDVVERVVVFGHPTLSREVPALVQRDGVETIAVDPTGIEWFNPGHRVGRFERAVHVAPGQTSTDDPAWVGRWVQASRALVDAGLPSGASLRQAQGGARQAQGGAVRSGIDETGHVSDYAAQREYMRAQLDSMRAPVTRRMLVDAVWAATWPHDRLVFGASRLIRDADRAVPGRRIAVHANRGLAGIDGTVATSLGIAIASQSAVPGEQRATDASAPITSARTGVTRALVGDLTLLHDVGSLLLGAGEPRPRIQVIVGNDGGGTIFDALEVAGTAPPEAFDRVQYTPQRVDLAALAAAYGWDYVRATTRGELDEALAGRIDAPQLVEVPIPR
ncbi:2-succinyl-5-enolpyruvyl-6-hydroxy-3-cyclohexene-1-carboxylic-acid synthase [Agromyces sp. NPDC058484]|uniref:2-succinyl-5-enolpyruvyl-6-hydroxy-3- cyclohexene-1-carboxylic-acid synthase n=1 Tax=Agromyces sp. NPDC058484 TaxID=3346524 RepID=UPI0036497010